MRIRVVIGSFSTPVAVASLMGETRLGTAFTYQGQLKQGGAPLEGAADFQFTLWDAAGSGNPPTGGTQVGGVQAINALLVTAGRWERLSRVESRIQTGEEQEGD